MVALSKRSNGMAFGTDPEAILKTRRINVPSDHLEKIPRAVKRFQAAEYSPDEHESHLKVQILDHKVKQRRRARKTGNEDKSSAMHVPGSLTVRSAESATSGLSASGGPETRASQTLESMRLDHSRLTNLLSSRTPGLNQADLASI